MSNIRTRALACRDAAPAIATLDADARRALLRDMAAAVDAHAAAILDANAKDMAGAADKGVQGAMLDRLKLDATRVAAIAKTEPDPAKQIEALYLSTLSRPPEPSEVETCLAYLKDAASPEKGLQGVMWSLLNTREFLLQH